MSIAECFNAVAGKRLAVVGFLSKEGARDYGYRGGLDFNSLPTEQVRELLVKGEYTPANLERLRAALQADIATLQCQYSWANCLAIATPGLELLTNEEVATTGLEVFSQSKLLVEYCLQHNLRSIALLGTEWDIAANSPLVRALEENDLEVWTPRPEYWHGLSICAMNAMDDRWISTHSCIVSADDFCAEATSWLIHDSCTMLDGVVICNPELRPLLRSLRARRKRFFATAPMIDLPGLYWDFLSKQLSQSQEKSPS